jgi:hypothetical protein
MLDSHDQFTQRLLLDLAPKCADIQAFQDEHSHLIIGAPPAAPRETRLQLYRETLVRVEAEDLKRRRDSGLLVPSLFTGYCTSNLGCLYEELGDFQLAQGHLINGLTILDRQLGDRDPLVQSMLRHVMMHYA